MKSTSKTAPAFLITIDTEGDNLWASPENVTTENSRFLPRFQDLCESYGMRPTWLTNFEMGECSRFVEFGRNVLKRRSGEIGMHLHAWNSPPLAGILDSQAYLIEYPVDVMADKIRFITNRLEDRFECKMMSHRAGRWAFNAVYARLLDENGYKVDCSVTPHVSWTHVLGDPRGAGGTDYSHYPSQPYFVDLDHIDRRGNSSLLEAPVSIVVSSSGVSWLRPNGTNRNAMLEILQQADQESWSCVEFMLHSSELMPGGSPTFQTGDDIEALYRDLDILFDAASQHFRGSTLSEFYDEYSPRDEGSIKGPEPSGAL